MMETSFRFGEVFSLADQIETAADKVQFKNIFSNENGGVVLLAFKEGQKLAEHLAPADVMVMVIEGAIEFAMLGTPHTISAGQFILMGQGVPHSVIAKADSKIMLIKVKA